MRDCVETLDQKTDVSKLWKTIEGIDGRAKREADNEAITFDGSSFSLSKQISSRFNNSSTRQSWEDTLLQVRPD